MTEFELELKQRIIDLDMMIATATDEDLKLMSYWEMNYLRSIYEEILEIYRELH